MTMNLNPALSGTVGWIVGFVWAPILGTGNPALVGVVTAAAAVFLWTVSPLPNTNGGGMVGEPPMQEWGLSQQPRDSDNEVNE